MKELELKDIDLEPIYNYLGSYKGHEPIQAVQSEFNLGTKLAIMVVIKCKMEK